MITAVGLVDEIVEVVIVVKVDVGVTFDDLGVVLKVVCIDKLALMTLVPVVVVVVRVVVLVLVAGFVLLSGLSPID